VMPTLSLRAFCALWSLHSTLNRLCATGTAGTLHTFVEVSQGRLEVLFRHLLLEDTPKRV